MTSMNHTFARGAAALALVLASAAWAGPGAHGPGGEHLDAPAGQTSAASAAPTLEATSELFELVATLTGGELSILVDRFDTNEPVLGARLELEVGSLKAVAKFHSDVGTYAVEDPAMLQALARPGEHALVFTVVAGDKSDLLDGTLRVTGAAAGTDQGHDDHLTGRQVAAVGGAVLLAAAAVLLFIRRRTRQGALQ